MIGKYGTIRVDLIEEWAAGQFPEMKGSTADEWRLFLNERTGLDIKSDARAGMAFDAWRKALGLL